MKKKREQKYPKASRLEWEQKYPKARRLEWEQTPLKV